MSGILKPGTVVLLKNGMLVQVKKDHRCKRCVFSGLKPYGKLNPKGFTCDKVYNKYLPKPEVICMVMDDNSFQEIKGGV